MSNPATPVLCITRTAGATLAANRLVQANGTYPTAGGVAIGVTRSAAVSGDLIPVDVLGTAVIESGGAVALNGPVQADASGRIVSHTGSNTKVGIALGSAGAAGALVEVLLLPSA